MNSIRSRRLAIALGLVVLVAGVVTTAAVAYSRASAASDNPVQIPPAKTVWELDLGEGKPDSTLSGATWLVNDTTHDLRILKAKPTCGCTTIESFEPTVLRPGDRMNVELSMTTPKDPGETKSKKVQFILEDGEHRELLVHTKARTAS